VRENDDSYLGPPLDSLEDSNKGINKMFKMSTNVDAKEKDITTSQDAIREEDEDEAENEAPKGDKKVQDQNQKSGPRKERTNFSGLFDSPSTEEKPIAVVGKRTSTGSARSSASKKNTGKDENDGMRKGHIKVKRGQTKENARSSGGGGEKTENDLPPSEVGNSAGNGTGAATNFQSFNATWKPNPTAPEFFPVDMNQNAFMPAPMPMQTMPPPPDPRRTIGFKRNRRTLTQAWVNGLGGDSLMIQSDNASVVESVASMKPKLKKKRNNSSLSLDSEMKKEPPEMTEEDMEKRMKVREMEISKFKSTEEYAAYHELVPKDKRTPEDPATPDPKQTRVAKRTWKFNGEAWHRQVRDRVQRAREEEKEKSGE